MEVGLCSVVHPELVSCDVKFAVHNTLTVTTSTDRTRHQHTPLKFLDAESAHAPTEEDDAVLAFLNEDIPTSELGFVQDDGFSFAVQEGPDRVVLSYLLPRNVATLLVDLDRIRVTTSSLREGRG